MPFISLLQGGYSSVDTYVAGNSTFSWVEDSVSINHEDRRSQIWSVSSLQLFGEKRVSGLTLGSWGRPLKRNCLNNSPAFQRVTQGSWTLWMQENPVCKELSSQPSASLCKRPAEQAIRTYISTRIYLGVLTDKQIVMQSDRTYLKVVFGQVNNDIPGAGVNLITHNKAMWKNCDIFVMKW